MQTGVALFVQNYTDWDRHEAGDWESDPAISDSRIFEEELVLGDLVEPLGFDSLWTVEHHFTPYTMDTNTLQFLSYFAGRTSRIDFGTMVVVLPWHDPIRVAEEASMLAHFLQGRRLILGFGRGAAKVEFDGMRVDMSSSRERFLEALDVVRKALSSKRFSHDGKYFQIPELSLRPRPPTDLCRDMHMSWGSPSSVAVAAENGLKPLVLPQKGWDTHVEEMREYNGIMRSLGREPASPTVLLTVYVDDDPVRAEELGYRYTIEYADSARLHYKIDDPQHLLNVTGYEYYSDQAKQFQEKHPDAAVGSKALLELSKTVDLKALPSAELFKGLVECQVWGTPDQVREKLRDRLAGVGAERFVGVFKFGSMPLRDAQSSLRLFASDILPDLKAMPTPAPILPD